MKQKEYKRNFDAFTRAKAIVKELNFAYLQKPALFLKKNYFFFVCLNAHC